MRITTWMLALALALVLSGPAAPSPGGENRGPGSGSQGPGKSDDKNDDKKDDQKPDDNRGPDPDKPEDNNRPDDRAPAAADAAVERRIVMLTATPTGAAIDASGKAETRVRGARQRFKVEVEARLPDGVVFVVEVDGRPAGSITLMAGEGELEVKNFDGMVLPAGLDPVSTIRRVRVLSALGVLVLEGSF